VNGLTAASGAFTAQSDQTTLTGRVSFVSLDGNTYRLLGYTSAQQAGAYGAAIVQSLGTFRRLTDPVALAAQPARVHLVRISRAMSLAQFNQTWPSSIPLAQLALINGVDTTGTLNAGSLVKRVATP
jgi:predicted Zn-dependent protease